MESARTHSFRIISLSCAFLILGFLLGFYASRLSNLWCNEKPKEHLFASGSSITTKRMQAIKEAQRLGKDTYEFEILALHPILGKN